MPILALSRWAAATQARDQVEVSRLSTADIRTEIAIATAQAYLAILALKRQVDVNVRARETALAHLDYAQRRLSGWCGNEAQRVARGTRGLHRRGTSRDRAIGSAQGPGSPGRARSSPKDRSTLPESPSSMSARRGRSSATLDCCDPARHPVFGRDGSGPPSACGATATRTTSPPERFRSIHSR